MSAQLPPGFVLDQPGLPQGFTVDSPNPSLLDAARKKLGAAVALTPPGVMFRGMEASGDLADRAAYSAGGKVTDLTGSPAAGYAANVGVQAIPALLGGEAAKVASPAFRAGAEKLMHSALKPPLDALRSGEAARAISTLLDEGINVTKGGVAKLRSKISDLNNEISAAIRSSPATVNKHEAAKELYSTVQKFEKQVTPKADLDAINGVWDEFLSHPLIKGDEMPVQLAQEMKQGTYRVLRDKYGEMGSAATEAQKDLARGLKNEVAKAVPEVSALNKADSDLINALNATERRVLVSMNKNPVGLSLLANNPAAAAVFMADRSELFKSLMARMLNANKTAAPASAGRVIGAGAGASTANE